MKILIATLNPAKLERYRRMLADYPQLEPRSPQEMGLRLTVEENGATAAENARLKASQYAAASGLPALGIDEALFIPGLPAEEQPGVYVRRKQGRALSDEELLATFQEKARGVPEDQRGVRWVFAVCLAMPEGRFYETEAGWDGILTDQPRLPISPGYPLSSILIDAATGKLVRDLTAEESRQRDRQLAERVVQILRRARLLQVEL